MATYFRSYTQALPVIEALQNQVLAVAKEVAKTGEVLVRDAGADDFGLTDFALTVPAGNKGDIDFIGTSSSPYAIPDRKAYGLYGILLEVEDPAVHVDYVDLYVGGSRVRRWTLHPVKDASANGKVLYFSQDNAIILKEGAKINIKVRAVNEDTANAKKIRIIPLAFVGEPKGDILMKG